MLAEREPPSHDDRQRQADDNRQLIDDDQSSAQMRRRDFGDVHRRYGRGQTDAHSAHKSPDREIDHAHGQ